MSSNISTFLLLLKSILYLFEIQSRNPEAFFNLPSLLIDTYNRCYIISFLNLEVIVSAVIVKSSFVSIQYHFGILVKLRLEKINLFCKDFQCTVNVMELAVSLFKACGDFGTI